MFNINQNDDHGTRCITLSGRLDALAAPDCETALRDAAGCGARRFLLDLSSLEYAASAGLRVFLAFAKLARKADARLAFCGLAEPVRQVFDLTGFTEILSVFPTREDAARFLNG